MQRSCRQTFIESQSFSMCPFTDVSVRGESWCQQKRGGEGWCGEEGRKGKVFSNWRPIDFYPSPACMQLQLQLVNFNHIRRCRGTLSVRINLCRIANWKHLGGRRVSRITFSPVFQHCSENSWERCQWWAASRKLLSQKTPSWKSSACIS